MGRKKKGLEIGHTYKSLKDMCSILKLEYKDGTNSKIALSKKIESEYKLEKQGKEYLVLERYNTPKEIKDKRKETKGNFTGKGKYGTLMDSLLIDWLYENDEPEINISFTELFLQNDEIINIPLFLTGYKNLLNSGYENYAKQFNINKKDLVNIYGEKMYLITSKCLEIALNRLQKQEIISWTKEIMVKYYVENNEIADEHLIAEIKQAEKEVYEETELTPFHRRNPKVNKKFKNKVYKKLAKHQISSYWNVYSIVKLDIDKIYEIENVDEIRIELTNKFTESILVSLLKKKYKFKKEMALGKARIEERLAFKNQEEDISRLSGLLFIDYKKDYYDFWGEIADNQNEEVEDEEIDFSLLF